MKIKLSRLLNFEVILFSVILIVLLVDVMMPTRKPRLSEQSFTVPTATKMTAEFDKEDAVKVPVAAGTEVQIAGYSGDGLFLKYLAVTPDGSRAFLRPDQIDIPVIPKYGPAKGQKVKVTKALFHDSGELKDFEGVTEDGTKVEHLGSTNFLPVFEGVNKLAFEAEPRQAIMTKEKFESKLPELTLDNCEKLIGPIQLNVPDGKGGRRVSFFANTLDKSDGHLYLPSVTFDAEGKAVSHTYKHDRYRNGYALKYLPGTDKIADIPLTSWLIRSNLYRATRFGDGAMQTVLKYIVYIFGFIGELIWIFCLGALPVAFIWALMHWRYAFYPLGDRMLLLLAAVVGIVSAYYWYVCLILWGAYALFALLMIPVVYFIYKIVAWSLDNDVPHRRCPKCRRLDTICYTSTDSLGSTTSMRDASEDRVVRDNSTATEQYTHVKYKDGFSMKTNRTLITNINQDMETTTYRQQVRTDQYREHFRCSCCGYKEDRLRSQSTVLSSKRTGISRWRNRDTVVTKLPNQ